MFWVAYEAKRLYAYNRCVQRLRPVVSIVVGNRCEHLFGYRLTTDSRLRLGLEIC